MTKILARGRRASRWWVLGLAVGAALGACVSELQARRELDEAIQFYHRDLRWQRFDQAAARLAPELRTAFLVHCADLEGRLALQEIDLVSVEVDESNEAATVVVRFTYVLAPALTLQREIVTQRWARQGYSWLLVEGVWPRPPEAAPSAPQSP